MAAGHPLLMIGGVVPFWRAASGVPVASLLAAAYGNDIFVAFDAAHNEIARSADNGATWSNITGASNRGWNAGAYGAPSGVHTYIAGSGTGYIQYSTSAGLTWAETLVSGGAGFSGIAYSASQGMFMVTVLSSNAFWKSSSGTGGWTSGTMASNSNWTGITRNEADTKWIAVNTNNNTNQIATCPDNINWTLKPTPSGPFTITSVSAGNGIVLCPIGGTRSVMRSTDDGETWTKHDNVVSGGFLFPGGGQPQSCAFDSGYFITSSVIGNLLAHSIDGLTWVEQNMGVAFGTPRAALGSNNKYFITTDSPPYVFLGH